MIQSYCDDATEDIFNGFTTKNAIRKLPLTLWNIARRRLDQIDSVEKIEDLGNPPGNRLEALGGNRKDQYSIRTNKRYRICFTWSRNGPSDVEVVDYH